MTVGELIEKLQTYNSSLEVKTYVDGGYWNEDIKLEVEINFEKNKADFFLSIT